MGMLDQSGYSETTTGYVLKHKPFWVLVYK